jgi:hypothetical protein
MPAEFSEKLLVWIGYIVPSMLIWVPAFATTSSRERRLASSVALHLRPGLSFEETSLHFPQRRSGLPRRQIEWHPAWGMTTLEVLGIGGG